jgi:hypothetical protein
MVINVYFKFILPVGNIFHVFAYAHLLIANKEKKASGASPIIKKIPAIHLPLLAILKTILTI